MAPRKSRKAESRSPSARTSRRQGPAGWREQGYRPSAPEPADTHEVLTPVEHYRREKERRAAEQRGPAADPLEEARREYRAMLAADAAKQKGGRPKKAVARPVEPEEAEVEELEHDPDADVVEETGEGDGDEA